jgi:hypothetical protein
VGRDAVVDTVGTVSLRSATIRGDLTVALGRLHGTADTAAADLSFVTARVLGLRGAPRRGLVDLTRASVHLLSDEPGNLTRERGTAAVLDGFEYDDISGLGVVASPDGSRRPSGRPGQRHGSALAVRLDWLADGTWYVRGPTGGYDEVRFTPQPYRQLAAVFQRNGRDDDERRVLRTLHQQRNLHKPSSGLARVWNVLQDRTIGYGYAPRLALGWLLVLAGLSAAYSAAAGVGPVPAVLRSLGLLLPGTGFSNLAPWDTAQGVWGHVIAGVLVLCGLVLGATVVAGLARVVKK